MDAIRSLIMSRAQAKGFTLAKLSKMAGKNHAYMQQFVQRGTPAKLPEDVRTKLAAALDVDEQALGAPLRSEPLRVPVGQEFEAEPHDPDAPASISSTGERFGVSPNAIPEYDLRAGASYGGGYAQAAQAGAYRADVVRAEWVIPPNYLQGELRLNPHHTDVLPIDGPSMLPDLAPGDRVLIDRTHRDPRQGGIFAVREGDGIIIKHVELVRGSDPPRIVCKSSNPTYSPFDLIIDGENVEIIGRVAGRISRM